jgi:hypothetical protein
MLSRHQFECGCSVDIMEFLGFVHDGFDTWALEKGDFSNYVPVWMLLRGEIIVSDMACCLETVWVRYAFQFWVLKFVEELLAAQIGMS